MQFQFTYRLPINEHDIEGSAEISEHAGGPDADGYQTFQVDKIEFKWGVTCKTSADRQLAAVITAWVKGMLEADEDLTEKWDDHVGNDVRISPAREWGTYQVHAGSVA